MWEEALLIGGGPSLCGFDFDRLRGRTVVAINDAMCSLPWAPVMFSADSTWVENRQSELASFKGERYLAIARPTSISDVEHLIRGRGVGLSIQWPIVNIHGTSGYGALNLAFLKGAKTIFLLGYDYSQANHHWYQNYTWQGLGRDHVFEQWAKHFVLAATQLQAAGVKVYNACPESVITAFPKIKLGDVI